MKLCLIAPADNYHIQKWSSWFTKRGHEVHVVSFTKCVLEGATVHWLNVLTDVKSSDIRKILYLSKAREIRRAVKEIAPDVISVHYATSYGTAVALSGIRKYALSVWGSDIYDFPRKSCIHKYMVKYSLSRASYLLSTSQAMAKEAEKYTKKSILITPFGVDMEMFSPALRNRRNDDQNFIVGTVKGLEPKYGIDIFLQSAAVVHQLRPDIDLKLHIAGKGTHEKKYKQLAHELGLSDITKWLGFISQKQAAQEWANMDVAVIPSTKNSDSFGVSAVEAQACGIPLIISDIPGLMEATSPGNSCICVPRQNIQLLAKAIIQLYDDIDLRRCMGITGRNFAKDHYELNHCFQYIEKIFLKMIDEK